MISGASGLYAPFPAMNELRPEDRPGFWVFHSRLYPAIVRDAEVIETFSLMCLAVIGVLFGVSEPLGQDNRRTGRIAVTVGEHKRSQKTGGGVPAPQRGGAGDVSPHHVALDEISKIRSPTQYAQMQRLHVRLHGPEIFKLMQRLDIPLMLQLTRPFVHLLQ
jgi:hypothetical protein